jgi:hypothetical protein
VLRRPERLAWGLLAFIYLLPFHILTIAYLYGGLGWPAPFVRVIAAWKEALLAGLLGAAILRAFWRGGDSGVRWLDLAVGGLAGVAVAYLVGAESWFDQGLPVAAQLYGWRDAVFASLLYFVGRATPGVAMDPRVPRALFIVGVVTSAIALVERLVVTPGMLVILGAARYVQQFLGATPITKSNVFGLPDNYWTMIGDHLVQRVGSTYLSSQGFAIPFLIILPAATLWLLSDAPRRRWLVGAGYGLLWVGLLLTVTRMTIAVAVLQTLIIVVAQRRWGRALGLLATGVAALSLAVAVVPDVARFVWQTLTWQSGSSQSHLSDWSTALVNLPAHPLGAGLGSADFVAARFGITALAADNQYLKYAVELGVLGLAFHVVVLGGLCATGLRVWRRGRAPAERSTGLLVGVTGLGIALNALTAVVMNSTLLAYVFYWLAGAATSVAARADRPEPA